MKASRQQPGEAARLQALRRYSILDTPEDPVLDELTTLCAKICGAPICLISLIDEDRQWAKSRVGLEAREIPREVSLCAHTIEQRQIFEIHDTLADDRFRRNPFVMGEPGIRFYAGAPLVTSEGFAIGALCVMDRVPRMLTEIQGESLRVLGRQVMAQIELGRQQLELRESEQRLRIVTENARVGLVIVSPERRYLYANHTYAQILRLESSDIVGKELREVIGGFYEGQVRPRLDQAFGGQRVAYELKIPGAAGSDAYYAVRYEPKLNGDSVSCVVVVISEITERKQAELNLEREHQELQIILDGVPTPVFYKDRVGRFIRVNQELARMVGVRPEEFVGKSDAEMGSSHGEQYLADDLRVMETREPLRQIEEKLFTKTGERWLLTNKVPFIDENGIVRGVIGFAVDITERKLAEQARTEASRLTQCTFDALSASICVIDERGTILTTNQAWKRFADNNTPRGCHRHEGENYLDVCDKAIRSGYAIAETFAKCLREVIHGSQPAFSLEYPCHSPTEQRWFVARVTRFEGDGCVRVVIAHEEITARKISEQVSLQMASIVQSSDDAIMARDIGGSITNWNRGARRIFGFEESELVGTLGSQLLPEDRLEEERWLLDQICQGKSIEHFETTRITKDGRRIHVSITASPIRGETGAVVGESIVARDITERKQIELARLETEQRLVELADNVQEALWMLDPREQRMLYVSPGYHRIWRREARSLESNWTAWMDHVHTEDRQHVLDSLRKGIQNGVVNDLFRIVLPDESLRWIRMRTNPIRDDSGSIRRIVGTWEDISDQRQLEAQLHQAQRLEAVGTLAAGIAHDFNNILGAILGNAELALLEPSVEKGMQEYMDGIIRASSRAKDLVRQILAFSRMQEQNRSRINLAGVLEEALKLLRPATPSSIVFDTILKRDCPLVLADSTQIHQILMNLGANAIHAIGTHPGRISIRLEVVDLHAELPASSPTIGPGRFVRLSIADTGCGMTAKVRERIFEPFFTTKRPGEGTGLGMSVVHGIMQRHDGAIEVSSTPNRGTTVSLYFRPLRDSAPVEIPEAPVLSRGKGEEILWIDDEPELLIVGKNALKRLGYKVTVAAEPQDAVNQFLAEPKRFSAIITDLTMPGMSGIDLATLIRQTAPNVPIILTTGFASAETQRQTALIGITEVLMKPASVQEVAECLERVLRATVDCSGVSSEPHKLGWVAGKDWAREGGGIERHSHEVPLQNRGL